METDALVARIQCLGRRPINLYEFVREKEPLGTSLKILQPADSKILEKYFIVSNQNGILNLKLIKPINNEVDIVIETAFYHQDSIRYYRLFLFVRN